MPEQNQKKSFLQDLFIKPLSIQAHYGLFASLSFVGAVFVFILCTLIFEHIPGSLDMTGGRLYTLSESSRKLLKEVRQDISITLVWQKEIERQYNLSQMYTQADNVLKQYAEKNPRITYRVVDPVVNPELVSAYARGQNRPEQGCIIVAGAQLQRIIPFETWAGFYGRQRVKLNVESPVSNAVLYITTGKMPKIYALSGHEEVNPAQITQLTGQSFQEALIAENFAVEGLSLRTQVIPEDADAVMILTPKSEFGTEEIRQLEEYLLRGGRVWINLGLADDYQLPRLYTMLKNYGLEIRGMAAESDAEKLLPNMQNNPLYFKVSTETSEITRGLEKEGSPLIMGQSSGIFSTGHAPAYVRLHPLLKTSDRAILFGRTADRRLVRLQEKREIYLAYAAEIQREHQDMEKEGRLLITGGDLAVMSSFPASAQFYLQGLQWLAGSPESLNIPGRNLVELPLNINVSDFVIFSFVFVIAMPALLLVAGFAVWNKRRRM